MQVPFAINWSKVATAGYLSCMAAWCSWRYSYCTVLLSAAMHSAGGRQQGSVERCEPRYLSREWQKSGWRAWVLWLETGCLLVTDCLSVNGCLLVTCSWLATGCPSPIGRFSDGFFNQWQDFSVTLSLSVTGSLLVMGCLSVTVCLLVKGSLLVTGSLLMTGCLSVSNCLSVKGSLLVTGSWLVTGCPSLIGCFRDGLFISDKAYQYFIFISD